MRTIYRVEAGWCSQHTTDVAHRTYAQHPLGAPVDPWAGQPLFPSWWDFFTSPIA